MTDDVILKNEIDNLSLNQNDSQYKIHQKKLPEKMFELVEDEKKIVECFIDNKNFKIKSGDFINFINEDNNKSSVMVQIIKITKHNDLEKALRAAKLKNILPGFRTIKEGISYYDNIFKIKNEDKLENHNIINLYFTTNS